MSTLILYTPYGNSYKINAENGFMTQSGNDSFSGQWIFMGLRHVKRNEFIPLKALTPEKLASLNLRYKNGNPQYTVQDLDYGTQRIWGNTSVHGVGRLYYTD